MKKIILSTCIALLPFTGIIACDICGCGTGSSYIGLLPEFKKTIFGFRYRNNSLLTHIGADGTITYLTSNERYHIIEAWTGWNINPRVRIMATVPLNYNERQNQGLTSGKTGLGDMSAQVYYQLLNRKKAISGNRIVQTLYAGLGIKLPTGKYSHNDKGDNSENPNLFQLGSGSVDFNFNAIYDIRLQDNGINSSVNYKMNTTNKYHYSYGNKFSGNVQAYHKFGVTGNITLSPNAGILYETAAVDSDAGIKNDKSGGYLLSGTVGLETTFNRFSVGGNWQTPLQQNLAGGFVKAQNKMMVHVSILL